MAKRLTATTTTITRGETTISRLKTQDWRLDTHKPSEVGVGAEAGDEDSIIKTANT